MKRTERTPDDARHWLAEAEMRLEHARGYVPGGNARIFTEQAHYAAEFSLKAVIVSRGGIFATTHNIQELLDTTRRLGETIPPAVVPAQELTAYAGAGRYDLARHHAVVPVSADEHGRALDTATATYQWATTRVQEILGAPDRDPVVAPGSGAGGGSGGDAGGARRPLKPGGSSDTPYPKPSPPTGPKAAPAPGGDKGRGER